MLKFLNGERALVPHVIDLFENNNPAAARDTREARRQAAISICQSGAPALRIVPTIMIMERQELLTVKAWSWYASPFRDMIRQRVYQLKQPPAALVDLIDHPDTQVRQWAISVLSGFGPAEMLSQYQRRGCLGVHLNPRTMVE